MKRSILGVLLMAVAVVAAENPDPIEPPGPVPPPSDRPETPVETDWGTIPLAELVPRDEPGPEFGPPADLAEPPPARTLPDTLRFGVGERLDFSIDYGVINAGGATMEVAGFRTVMGRRCLDIRTEAKSNHFFSAFYKVWDRAETFFDPETMLPWRFEKKLREGGYRKNVLVKYDRRHHFALYENGDSIAIHPHVQDELSAFYFVRALDLQVGRDVLIDSHSGRKNYPLRVVVHGKETIEVPAGKFDCLVIEPMMREGGIFSAKGKMTIWVTDDERRMPVLMKSKVLVGAISASLRDYRLGDPLPRGTTGDPTVASE